MFRRLILSTLLIAAALGCQATVDEGPTPTRADVMAGKADGAEICGYFDFAPGCDLCQEFGWYGDGYCDQSFIDLGYCAGPDSDCGAAPIVFQHFRLGKAAGPCPPGVDCSGFIELHADGTLRFDNFGELPAVVHEARITDAELDHAVAVLTDPELMALLALEESPCVAPTDIYESMQLSLEGEDFLENSTTFCDDASLEAARRVLLDLVARYTPAPAFESFRLHRTAGPCPPGVDCNGFIELRADGTLRVDRFGELPAIVHETTVSSADLDDAIVTLTDPALVALLSMDESPCVGPTDIYESMKLTVAGEELYNSVTFCDDTALDAARDTLRGLADHYLP